MNTRNAMRRRPWMLALLPLTLIAVVVGGCIFPIPQVCFEGDVLCDDEYVLECVYGEWVVLQDCYDLCLGTCTYFNGNPACECMWPEPSL
jgi:hypothetical protein